jgi:Domain of unknown function (DUF4384)
MKLSNYLAAGLLPLLLGPVHAQQGPSAQLGPARDLSVEQVKAYEAGVPHPGSLRIVVRTDHPDDTFAIGETARLFVSSNEDAFVTVFDIGPSGQVHQLFPNSYQRDNRIAAGQQREIAGGESGARIAVSGPVGVELIKVVASDRPLVVVPENLLQGSGAFRSVEGGVPALSRNLEVVSDVKGEGERKIDIENFALRTVEHRGEGAPTIVVIPGQREH